MNHFTTNVYGHGANLAFGDNATQRSKVVVNDVDSLLTAARELGLSDDGLAELRLAAEAPPEERPSRFKNFVEKVKSGTYLLGTQITSEVAASQLNHLLQQFLGQI